MTYARRLPLAIALACITLQAGCASLVAPKPTADREKLRSGAYVLDPEHVSVLFKIDHLGFSTYVGRFKAVEASLDFDAADPSAARLEAIIEIASLDVPTDAFAQTLTGPGWFDAGAFPQAIFRSETITVTGDNTGRVEGGLTLHGVTAPFALDVVFNGGDRDFLRGAYVIGFSATGRLDRTQFGVDKFSGVIADEVLLEIEAEFIRR